MAYGPVVLEDAGLGVGVLVTFAAFLICLGLRFAWKATLGLLFSEIAKAMHKIPKLPGFLGGLDIGAKLAAPFETIDNLVYTAFGFYIEQTEHAWHRMTRSLAYIVTAQADEVATLAEETLRGLEWLHTNTSPTAIWRDIRHQVEHATSTAPATKVIVRPATKAAVDHYPQLAARVGRLEKEIAHVGTKTITITHPGVAIPRTKAPARTTPAVLPVPRVAEIDKTLKWAKGQIGRLGKLATVAGLVGLVAGSLARLGNGWLRCPRVNDAGKKVCGMDPGLLESLLADTLLIAGTVSLVEFAKGMQGITADVAGPIRTFWRVV